MKQSMKFKYTEYHEVKKTQFIKTHNPPIAHISLIAFDSLTDDRKGFVKVREWEDKMKGLVIDLRDEKGMPAKGYMAYTHRFSLKLIDGEPCIGDPELGDDDDE